MKNIIKRKTQRDEIKKFSDNHKVIIYNVILIYNIASNTSYHDIDRKALTAINFYLYRIFNDNYKRCKKTAFTFILSIVIAKR